MRLLFSFCFFMALSFFPSHLFSSDSLPSAELVLKKDGHIGLGQRLWFTLNTGRKDTARSLKIRILDSTTNKEVSLCPAKKIARHQGKKKGLIHKKLFIFNNIENEKGLSRGSITFNCKGSIQNSKNSKRSKNKEKEDGCEKKAPNWVKIEFTLKYPKQNSLIIESEEFPIRASRRLAAKRPRYPMKATKAKIVKAEELEPAEEDNISDESSSEEEASNNCEENSRKTCKKINYREDSSDSSSEESEYQEPDEAEYQEPDEYDDVEQRNLECLVFKKKSKKRSREEADNNELKENKKQKVESQTETKKDSEEEKDPRDNEDESSLSEEEQTSDQTTGNTDIWTELNSDLGFLETFNIDSVLHTFTLHPFSF